MSVCLSACTQEQLIVSRFSVSYSVTCWLNTVSYRGSCIEYFLILVQFPMVMCRSLCSEQLVKNMELAINSLIWMGVSLRDNCPYCLGAHLSPQRMFFVFTEYQYLILRWQEFGSTLGLLIPTRRRGLEPFFTYSRAWFKNSPEVAENALDNIDSPVQFGCWLLRSR